MTGARLLGVAALAALEVYLYRRYALLGSQFHFWLHLLFGAAIGLSAWTVARVLRPTWRHGLLAMTALAHLWSAFPDVLFILGGVLHQRWMDVFAAHISMHFVPRPIVTSAVLTVLAGIGASLARVDRSRLAVFMVAMTALGAAGALLLRTPIPDTLTQVRADPQIVRFCPLPTGPVTPSPMVAVGQPPM
jgi:hypothetical protein